MIHTKKRENRVGKLLQTYSFPGNQGPSADSAPRTPQLQGGRGGAGDVMEERKGGKDKLGSYKCGKKDKRGRHGAAGRGRAGLYERGHWPGGGATWEIPSYSTQAERCHLPLAPTAVVREVCVNRCGKSVKTFVMCVTACCCRGEAPLTSGPSIHQIRQVKALCGGGSPRPPPLGLLDAPDGNATNSCLCSGHFWFAAQNILAAFAGTKSGKGRGQVHFTDARLDL
ncbi:hypothetical protein E2C01_028189 [Portunus trituberculatus]|uniref:Uncharacterized protein n=1 Tax=Portunus trituberculatus TaxID=210409 RepID=A0A5B7ENE0_PORTR|nr:hypothetical protein [Portunus trituberculatus]